MISRIQSDDDSIRISTAEADVPAWQRQLVWTPDEMGLLAYSILSNYPIGLVILWKKPNGVRVPIDGRQRLTAIQEFQEGRVAIPDLPGIPVEYRNRKYLLRPEDDQGKFQELSLSDREDFDDYEPQILQFESIDESTAMDIFIKLQGGKSLTKTEVRAALGGKVCDFVTELTSPSVDTDEADSDEIEPKSKHPFFQQVNIRNVRKAHRNVCDVLLHEHLYPGKNKHWASLEAMYREKSESLTDSEMGAFQAKLGRFQRDCSFSEDGGPPQLLPQLRSAFLVLTIFRAWSEIQDVYLKPDDFSFEELVSAFEEERVAHKDESPWLNFSAALSNAGYSEGRITERHGIFMNFVLQAYPEMELRDTDRRTFTESQKLAIWNRAGRRCEFEDVEGRCNAKFSDFREADADHIIRWTDGGPTTLENGRLLCQLHNRGGAA